MCSVTAVTAELEETLQICFKKILSELFSAKCWTPSYLYVSAGLLLSSLVKGLNLSVNLGHSQTFLSWPVTNWRATDFLPSRRSNTCLLEEEKNEDLTVCCLKPDPFIPSVESFITSALTCFPQGGGLLTMVLSYLFSKRKMLKITALTTSKLVPLVID